MKGAAFRCPFHWAGARLLPDNLAIQPSFSSLELT